jgi:hypothetical protein
MPTTAMETMNKTRTLIKNQTRSKNKTPTALPTIAKHQTALERHLNEMPAQMRRQTT